MNHTAFDYKSQTWKSGDEALQLLRDQCSETLELLNGSRGKDYARMMNRDHAEFLAETLARARTLD